MGTYKSREYTCEVGRFNNKKIKYVIQHMELVERYEDAEMIGKDYYRVGNEFHCSDVAHSYNSERFGPYVYFHENGTVERIGVDLDSYYPADSWSKEFDSKGKLLKVQGKQGVFQPQSCDMLDILENKGLMPAINKALAAKKKPTLKSTLKRGTKVPRKKSGKEM